MRFRRMTLLSVLLITGCAPYKVSVYGKSGTVYTAPSLCGALIQCMNSTETACYYDRTLYRDVDGKIFDESGGKEVKK